MRLVAGVTADPRADVTSGTTYPGVTPVSVNGGRSNTTNYVLDGANNNDHYSNAPNPMPNPDALQEFSVQTNNFSAEFGRQSGGVVNAITKSGTNERARQRVRVRPEQCRSTPTNFFAPIVNGKKQSDGLKRNQFGATLGGPVWIPKALQRPGQDVLLLLVSGNPSAPGARSSRRLSCPPQRMRAGDFSALHEAAERSRSPAANYANNQIPASRSARSASRSCSTFRCRPAATRPSPPRRTTSMKISGWFAATSRSAAEPSDARAGSVPSATRRPIWIQATIWRKIRAAPG